MGTFLHAVSGVCCTLLLVTQVSGQALQNNGDQVAGAPGILGIQSLDAPPAPDAPPVCPADFRTFDGICTNLANPLFGSINRPQLLPDGVSSTEFSRGDLPSARAISNAVLTQSKDVFSRRRLNELVTFFGQFIDHNFVASPEGEERMNIVVAKSDPIFANFTDGLPFIRSLRNPFGDGREGPSNALSSALDLSAVYGAQDARADRLREKKGGRLLTSAGNNLPFNSAPFLNNAPRATADFFVAGDHRSNEHPVLTALHTIFLREHNRLARKLEAAFPDFDDERLFQTARKINGAQFQKIVYDEFYPAMTGRRLPRFRGHDDKVDVTISAVFSTAAFRLGHTMVGNVVNRVGPNGANMSPLGMMDTFFRPQNILDDGIEPYLRGAARFRAQESDNKINSNIRNFLFTGIEGDEGFDLAALNIQRGRDHALPSFNDVRSQFGLTPYTKFSEITRNRNLQSDLLSTYRTIDRIDPWVGMVSEDNVRGASMGPTMLSIWKDQFTRLRDGDRFFFEIRGMFSREIRRAIPEIRRLRRERGTLLRILVANSDAKKRDFRLSRRGIFFTGRRG